MVAPSNRRQLPGPLPQGSTADARRRTETATRLSSWTYRHAICTRLAFRRPYLSFITHLSWVGVRVCVCVCACVCV